MRTTKAITGQIALLCAMTAPGTGLAEVVYYNPNTTSNSRYIKNAFPLYVQRLMQTFTNTAGSNYQVSSINLNLERLETTADSGNYHVDVFALNSSFKPTGSSLGHATLAANTVTTSSANYTVSNFTDLGTLAANTRYCFVLSIGSATEGVNWYGDSNTKDGTGLSGQSWGYYDKGGWSNQGGGLYFAATVNLVHVPEPSTLLLATIASMAGLAGFRYRHIFNQRHHPIAPDNEVV